MQFRTRDAAVEAAVDQAFGQIDWLEVGGSATVAQCQRAQGAARATFDRLATVWQRTGEHPLDPTEGTFDDMVEAAREEILRTRRDEANTERRRIMLVSHVVRQAAEQVGGWASIDPVTLLRGHDHRLTLKAAAEVTFTHHDPDQGAVEDAMLDAVVSYLMDEVEAPVEG